MNSNAEFRPFLKGYAAAAAPENRIGSAPLRSVSAEFSLRHLFCVLLLAVLQLAAPDLLARESVVRFAGESAGHAEVDAAAVAGDGSKILAGVFGTGVVRVGDKELASTSTTGTLSNGYVARVLADGTPVWLKRLGGGTGSVLISSAVTTTSGLHIVAGRYWLSGMPDLSLPSAGSGYSGFLAAFANDGSLVWARHYSASQSVDSFQAVSDGNGGVIAFGGYSGTFGTSLSGWSGASGGFMIRLAADASVVWALGFGGGPISGINSVSRAQNGDLLVTLVYTGALSVPSVPQVAVDSSVEALVMRLSSAGSVIWSRNFGGSLARVVPYGAFEISNGDIIVAANASRALSVPVSSAIGETDILLVKLSASGNLMGSSRHGNSNQYFFPSSLVLLNDELFIAGSPGNLQNVFVGTLTANDSFVARFNVNLQFVAAEIRPYRILSLVTDAAGALYMAGGTWPGTGGAITQGPYDGGMGFLARQDFGAGLSQITRVRSAYALGFKAAAAAADAVGNQYVAIKPDVDRASIGAFSYQREYSQEALVIKLDAAGTPLWIRKFASEGFTFANFVRLNPLNGNLLVMGNMGGSLLSPASIPGSGRTFVVELDSTTGAAVRGVVLGESAAGFSLRFAAVAPSGEIFLTGDLNGSAYGMSSSSSNSVYMLRLNPQLAVAGTRLFLDGSIIWSADAIQNDWVVAGDFGPTLGAQLGLTGLGQSNGFAARLRPDGSAAWARPFTGTSAYVSARQVSVTQTGEAYVSGSFFVGAMTNPALPLLGGADAFVARISSAGNLLWARGEPSGSPGPGLIDHRGEYLFINQGSKSVMRFDQDGRRTASYDFGVMGGVAPALSAIAIHASKELMVLGDFSEGDLVNPAVPGPAAAFLSRRYPIAVPATPQITGINANAQAVTVSFSLADQGGVPMLGFNVICSSQDGSSVRVSTGSSSPITVAGLTTGLQYTCTVSATNALGNSLNSVASASFIPGNFDLTVSLAGAGSGSVSSVPAGIACASDCSESLIAGTAVTLTSTPTAGSTFAGWSGVVCSGGNSNATCSFTLSGNTSVTATFYPVVGANSALNDLNDDGKSDIVWRNSSTGSNWYWAMNGTTITAQGPITTLPVDWQIQSTAVDFDGDGKSDILLRNMTTGQPWVWFMNGNSILNGGPLPTLSDLNWTIAGTGDLNGDGKGDVIWRNTSTGANWWWALNGTVIINQGQITGLPVDWAMQSTLGDFNGDGKTDILWRNSTTGQPWVWMMDGNTIINNGPLPTLSDLNWTIAGTGDLNGDGKHDVVWRNTATGANWYWALNGTTITAQGPITTLPIDWQIQSTSADFDGDGKADILLRNMTTGQPWIWFMNGNTILNGGPLPTLSDMNWQIRIRK